jgi:urease accessory protein
MNAWLLYQLADSAFPTGGFAHSAGLEAAAQIGEVNSKAELSAFCEAVLWQAGLGALPFVRASHVAHDEGFAPRPPLKAAPSQLAALDALCHAFLGNHVANRASRTQGRAFAATAARVFPRPAVARVDEAVRGRALRGHHPVVYGAVLAALGVAAAEAQRLYLHGCLRGVTSAAVRLGLAGPHEAQRLHHELAARADEVLARCEALSIDEIAQPAPLVDLFGATHDRLYARLFLS